MAWVSLTRIKMFGCKINPFHFHLSEKEPEHSVPETASISVWYPSCLWNSSCLIRSHPSVSFSSSSSPWSLPQKLSLSKYLVFSCFQLWFIGPDNLSGRLSGVLQPHPRLFSSAIHACPFHWGLPLPKAWGQEGTKKMPYKLGKMINSPLQLK